ncbi:hypothetical protein LWI29_034970 [Acer saccharum]|uniref:ABC transporter domain-containing protein n=1 Tax=Acer saccharum TaxID=4024 RepID=A0AA39SV05_ACESA|nr:hypothetical protein LWI29_034970 [Acer saccharum]
MDQIESWKNEVEVIIKFMKKKLHFFFFFLCSLVYLTRTQTKGSKKTKPNKMEEVEKMRNSRRERPNPMRAAESIGRSLSRASWNMEEVFSGSHRQSRRSSRVDEDEEALKWAAIEKLPTYDRLRTSIMQSHIESEMNGPDKVVHTEVDVTKLDINERQKFIDKLFKVAEEDNEKFLQKFRNRIEKVGIGLPTVEVRFDHLTIEADCYIGNRALPSLLNTARNLLESIIGIVGIQLAKRTKLTILKEASGIIKPSRMTLLLGPPSSGKTTLLLALAGKLDKSLKVKGEITYNGYRLNEFVPQKTSAYISQNDVHVGEMTVKETLDFSARCQGVGTRYDLLSELARREKDAGIFPEAEVDLFMKATAMKGVESSLITDYTLKILGLDICKDTIVGDDMQRGISGGQKKRVTTGEMIVGPTKTLFMDEISTGLDSSTTFQIVKCLQQIVHLTEASILMSLLQPAPETFDLFDDIILLSEGQIVYEGPREHILQFFETCGFRCPERKGTADFLQEVTSKKDQEQYWADKNKQYRYIPVPEFAARFKRFHVGMHLENELSVPISIFESIVWMAFTYYTIGFAPEASRFFKQLLLVFLIQQMASGLFRLIAGVCRTMIIANTGGALTLLLVFLLGGFILPKGDIPKWWQWGYWISPLSYGYNAFTVNEMFAPRWMNKNGTGLNNGTKLAVAVLKSFDIPAESYWYWIGAAALFGFIVLFNVLFTIALMYLNPLGKPQAIISEETAAEIEGDQDELSKEEPRLRRPQSKKDATSRSLSASDGNNLREMAMQRMSSRSNPNGLSRNGDASLEAVNGVAPKRGMVLPFTPLAMSFDSVNYYVDMPAEMKEQAFLRLQKEVSNEEKMIFVDQVMELVELNNLRDAIVGLPGITGLSTEQRKRLTIAVELVANPSIIFMDEPTSGLDARAAAIVMRTVRNTVDTGRTVVCTIHQPSIDIFEAFDELLLMKRGGQVIYSGPLGRNSHKIVEYFEAVPGVPKIKEKYNPATWMLEVSSVAAEVRLNMDFAEYYKSSALHQRNKALVKELSTPPPGAKDIYFTSQYSQSPWGQFKSCIWKQWWTYWRSPDYNLVRYFFTLVAALMVGTIFWKVGTKRDNAADLSIIIGAMYAAVLFVGINNCSTVQPIVAVERTVFYRERAAGMYSALPYALAQVIVEIPYVFVQTTYYSLIVYAMVSFEWTAAKFWWFFFVSFFSFLYFTYYGMMTVALTPNHQVAAIFAAAFYALFNLFSGFFIPRPKIPKWWVWYYWICPVAWTVYGLIVSQYGDVEQGIIVPGFPNEIPVNQYIKDHFGYDPNFMGPVAGVLVGFTVFFAFMFAYCIKTLNFQMR